MKLIPLVAFLFIASCNQSVRDNQQQNVQESPVTEEQVYLFSYFVGNGEDGLHLAWSKDGLKWEALNNSKSFLQPVVGESKLMRDPCITQSSDGIFHMVWTTSWNGQTIGYSNSKDLINWSEQIATPVMADEPNAVNCWAPEINYLAEQDSFMIYWSTTITDRFPETIESHNSGKQRNHRIYFTKTQHFENFTSASLLYEPGFNVIDASIYPENDRYLMFIKNETELPKAEKNIRIAWADEITGPYSEPTDPVTGDYWAEGPTAIIIDGKWHLYFDKYVEGEFGLLVSEDLKQWQDFSEQLEMPEDIRHGTVFSVERPLLEQLKNL